jgi:hypothetical protein
MCFAMTFVVNSQIVLRQADVIILVLNKCLLDAVYILKLRFLDHSEDPHLNICVSFTAIASEPLYCKTHEGFLAYLNGTGTTRLCFV